VLHSKVTAAGNSSSSSIRVTINKSIKYVVTDFIYSIGCGDPVFYCMIFHLAVANLQKSWATTGCENMFS